MNVIERLAANPRVTVRRKGEPEGEGRCVVYWMQRAQRGTDNPALDCAIEAANDLGQPVSVFFGLHPHYPNANIRHYRFLVEGLAETARRIEERGAAFVFRPYPDHDLIRFCQEVRASLVIGDENPTREPERWRASAARKLRVPFWTVDADVVVPTRLFSKQEYAARTLRPKIGPLIEVFLQPSENPRAHVDWKKKPASRQMNEKRILSGLPLDRSVSEVSAFRGGATEAMRLLNLFIDEKLSRYDRDRNLAHVEGTSHLSAYLHFGHISPVTVALAARNAEVKSEAKAAFLEELIVRRELAINFVARNPHYDRLEGCPDWALKSLARHSRDMRRPIYTEAELEAAETEDELWNAAQMEMVATGRMHGYLRMYWAKKILEWTRSPEEAFDIAVRLNDRYELDGRDPNGYAGISWAVGGRHDRPWARRPVFVLVRYMSRAGMERKFDVKAYIEKVRSLI